MSSRSIKLMLYSFLLYDRSSDCRLEDNLIVRIGAPWDSVNPEAEWKVVSELDSKVLPTDNLDWRFWGISTFLSALNKHHTRFPHPGTLSTARSGRQRRNLLRRCGGHIMRIYQVPMSIENIWRSIKLTWIPCFWWIQLIIKQSCNQYFYNLLLRISILCKSINPSTPPPVTDR